MARIDIGATSHADDEPNTFVYFGTELRTNPGLTDADLLDFMADHAELKDDDPAAAGILKSFMREVIHPDDFDTFWALARQHRQSTEERVKIMYALIEAAVPGTPTVQSSDSSAGLQRTDESSTDASSLRAQHRLEDKGRADLAVAVLQRREALHVA